jgi:Rad3-related DNA helicase
MSHQIDECFPFSKIRDEQRLAIDFALDAFESGKRFVVCELGTGVGKSATGISIARWLEKNVHEPVRKPIVDEDEDFGAYVLTTQKILQDQYVNDFGPSKLNLLRSIKSSTNYACVHYTDQTCRESRTLLNRLGKTIVGTEFFKTCHTKCPYKLDKESFIESTLGITNFSYFLAETMYAKKLKPRDFLIIDEAHTIQSECGKFIEVTFAERFAKEILKCKVPLLHNDSTKAAIQLFNWVKESYLPSLTRQTKRVEQMLQARFNSGATGFGELSKQYESLDKHMCKVNRFMGLFDPENWIMNIVEPTFNSKGKRVGMRKFEFKPIDVSSFTEDMLFRFGKNVLMLSATIINKDVFCRTIGLKPEDVAFLTIPSPFPVVNRPIHFLKVGKMSMDNIQASLPKIAQTVKLLLEQHVNDKGMIHTGNFRVAQYLFENVGSKRLIIHNSENREQMLQHHLSSKLPTVLLSPSMMEGVDLADDASRFQILCKVPFPYLGDQVVRKRKARDPLWYPFQTAKSVIQAMGRSVRNDTDHATSYILDEDWEYFFQRNRSLFPADFISALST